MRGLAAVCVAAQVYDRTKTRYAHLLCALESLRALALSELATAPALHTARGGGGAGVDVGGTAAAGAAGGVGGEGRGGAPRVHMARGEHEERAQHECSEAQGLTCLDIMGAKLSDAVLKAHAGQDPMQQSMSGQQHPEPDQATGSAHEAGGAHGAAALHGGPVGMGAGTSMCMGAPMPELRQHAPPSGPWLFNSLACHRVEVVEVGRSEGGGGGRGAWVCGSVFAHTCVPNEHHQGSLATERGSNTCLRQLVNPVSHHHLVACVNPPLCPHHLCVHQIPSTLVPPGACVAQRSSSIELGEVWEGVVGLGVGVMR